MPQGVQFDSRTVDTSNGADLISSGACLASNRPAYSNPCRLQQAFRTALYDPHCSRSRVKSGESRSVVVRRTEFMRPRQTRPVDLDRDRAEILGSGQFVQQPFRRLQIGGREPFGEAAMDRRQEIACLPDAALVAL